MFRLFCCWLTFGFEAHKDRSLLYNKISIIISICRAEICSNFIDHCNASIHHRINAIHDVKCLIKRFNLNNTHSTDPPNIFRKPPTTIFLYEPKGKHYVVISCSLLLPCHKIYKQLIHFFLYTVRKTFQRLVNHSHHHNH